MVQNNLGQKNFGSKKVLCLIFGPKKFQVQKKFRFQKILEPKKIGSKNIFGQTKMLGPTIFFWLKKDMG